MEQLPQKQQQGIPRAVKFLLGLCLCVLVSFRPTTITIATTTTNAAWKDDKEQPQHQHQPPHAGAIREGKKNNDANGTTDGITTTNTSAVKNYDPIRIFECGFDLWNFRLQLFGDLEFAGRLDDSKDDHSNVAKPTSNDILLQGGLNGPCSDISPEVDFPGKILFVHSEAFVGGDAEKQLQNERFFKLGPSSSFSTKDSNNSIRLISKVTFGAIYFISATTHEQRQWILDPTQKRKAITTNSQETRNAMVYVVHRCGSFRNEAAEELSSIVQVHQNPKCPRRNDQFRSIPKEDWTSRDLYHENWKLYSKYKYCLVMENTNAHNYITEKLFLAFLGGCLPIYSGTKDVFEIFNPEAFVYWDDKGDDTEVSAVNEIAYLQSNDTAYQEKLNQPILANGSETIINYLSLADDVGNGALKHQIRTMLGIH
eukprot:scaffold6428_cov103-Cylindrotheca_fusiformis.AAC.2